MSAPLKIAHVITGLPVGGAETLLCRLLERIDRARFSSIVICLGARGPLAERIERAGVPLRCLAMRGMAGLPRALWKLRTILRREQPAAVHTWMYHADLVGGLAAKLAGVPVMWSLHHAAPGRDGLKLSTRAVVSVLARFSRFVPARIVSCSQAAVTAHVAHGYAPGRMHVISNGTDCETFRPDEIAGRAVRDELGIPAQAPVVCTAGRFHPLKDYPNFFAAVLSLQQRLPETHFIACGAGVTPDHPSIRPFLERSRWPGRIHCTGVRHDLPAVLSAVDVFTLASRSEAFPLTIGEAMACARPCVATDAGDCRHLIGNTGRTVPIRDHESLAASWEEILTLPASERLAMGAAARRRVADHFDFGGMVRQYEHCYAALAERSTGSRAVASGFPPDAITRASRAKTCE